MNSKLHAAPTLWVVLRGFSDGGPAQRLHRRKELLDSVPSSERMLADRGYDADWYRDALEEKWMVPCIPSRKRAENPDPPRRNPIPNAAQDREQLRSAQGLAARRHALRQMPKSVSVSMRSRRCRFVLAMSPYSGRI